jgi:hypothetical protein
MAPAQTSPIKHSLGWHLMEGDPFVVYPGIERCELFRFHHGCETELDLVKLAQGAGSLALKRTESGLVSLVHEGYAYTIRGREWYVRPPIEQMISAVTPGRIRRLNRCLSCAVTY